MTEMKNEDILGEVRRITKLIAYMAVRDQDSKEQVEVLYNIGFQPKEIAGVLGKNPSTIRSALQSIKGRSKAKKGKT